MKKICLILTSLFFCSVSFAHNKNELGTIVFSGGSPLNRCLESVNVISSLSSEKVLFSSFCAGSLGNLYSDSSYKNKAFTKVILPSKIDTDRFDNSDYKFVDYKKCAYSLQLIELLGNNENGISINAYCDRDGLLKSWIILDDSYHN